MAAVRQAPDDEVKAALPRVSRAAPSGGRRFPGAIPAVSPDETRPPTSALRLSLPALFRTGRRMTTFGTVMGCICGHFTVERGESLMQGLVALR